MAIKIYRKGNTPMPKLNAAQRKQLERELSLRAKVRRPGIEELFISGQFRKLPVLAPAVVKNRAVRILDHEDDGWLVPESDMGRKESTMARTGFEPDEQSTANSIVAWIKSNLSSVVDHRDVSVVVE